MTTPKKAERFFCSPHFFPFCLFPTIWSLGNTCKWAKAEITRFSSHCFFKFQRTKKESLLMMKESVNKYVHDEIVKKSFPSNIYYLKDLCVSWFLYIFFSFTTPLKKCWKKSIFMAKKFSLLFFLLDRGDGLVLQWNSLRFFPEGIGRAAI